MAKLQTWLGWRNYERRDYRSKTEPVKEQQVPKETAGKPTDRRAVALKESDKVQSNVRHCEAWTCYPNEQNVLLWHTVTTIRRNYRNWPRVYLSAFGVDDEASAVVLNHMYEHSISFEGHKVTDESLAYIKNEVDLSYPTVQRAVKKMVDKAKSWSNQNILRIRGEAAHEKRTKTRCA